MSWEGVSSCFSCSTAALAAPLEATPFAASAAEAYMSDRPDYHCIAYYSIGHLVVCVERVREWPVACW